MKAQHESASAVPVEAIDDPLRLQISALLDGELDDASADRAIDALLASDAHARFWSDCHRAGDWLRSEDVVGVGDCDAFMQRFSAQLAAEPTVLAPKPLARRSSGFWMRAGLPSASVAAALVAVVWVAAPFGRHDQPTEVATVASAASTGASSSTAVVPVVAPVVVATETPIREVDADRLTDYVAAHRDVTPFGYRGASARPASYSPR